MRVKVKTYFGTSTMEKSVEAAVNDELSRVYADGQVERVADRVDKLINVVSNLAGKLAEKNLMTLDELNDVFGTDMEPVE